MSLLGIVKHLGYVERRWFQAVLAGRPLGSPDAACRHPETVHWSLRWVLLHIIEETARHAGHADIIRESINGATGV